jgi:hypothetical protein
MLFMFPYIDSSILLNVLHAHVHHKSFDSSCRNPNLAKCEGEAQHLEKFGTWSPPGLPNV